MRADNSKKRGARQEHYAAYLASTDGFEVELVAAG